MSASPAPSANTAGTAGTVRRRIAGLAAAVVTTGLAAGAVAVALPAAQAEAAGGHTYYVSPSGSDANSGTDAAHPFKTLGKVSNGFLQAGDTLLLQGRATFTDKLAVWSSGTAGARITISHYGHGKATLTQGCVDLGGDYLVLQGVRVTGCGDDSGVWVYGAHDVVQRIAGTHNIQSIVVDTHAVGTQILHNNLHDNDRMAPNTPGAYDDYGAIAVVVDGDDTEVAFNKMSDNVAHSADFGEDGSAVEIYGGVGTDVHDNTAVDNSTFTELGNARTANTTFTDNTVVSSLTSSQFLVTRGASDAFGPVAGTTASGNQVTLTGTQSTGYICYAGCTPGLLTLSDNTLDVAGRIGYLEGSLAGGDNTYWGGTMAGLPMLPGDQVAAPTSALADRTTHAHGTGQAGRGTHRSTHRGGHHGHH